MRPTRLAAFVLLGVAVIAVGLGVYALTGSNSPSSAAPAPTTTQTSQPKTTTPKPSPTTAPTTAAPPTSSSTGQATTVVPPPATTGAGGNGGNGGGQQAGPVPVRVYDNGTIRHIGQCAANDLTASGFDVVQLQNYSQGAIPTTTAYYNPAAPGEQDTATKIAQTYGMHVQPRFSGIVAAGPGVIVMVTNDFKGVCTASEGK
jgi:hypothetical protein